MPGKISQRLIFYLLIILASAPTHPALAAGGAHVIDDAAVETPGTCHLESWVTRYDPHRGLFNFSPACTREAWPKLEIGAAVQHIWDSIDDTTIGPALKLNVRPLESGAGIALSVAGAWSVNTGKLETASFIVPVTLPVYDWLQVNINGGWTYSRASDHRHAAIYGAQIEASILRDVGLMAEAFRRDHNPVGAQFGLRWNPGGGAVDVDVLYGRRIDGVSPHAVSLGLTIRH